jgi:hypothetical protein
MVVKYSGGRDMVFSENNITNKQSGISTQSKNLATMFLKNLKTSNDIIKENKKKGNNIIGLVKLKNKVNPTSFDNFISKLLINNKNNKPFNFVSAESNIHKSKL